MATETVAKDGKADGKAILKMLAPGQEVERAIVAADGTVTIVHGKAKLLSVDIADVDLLLSFSDGSYVIIPHGALDAIGAEAHTVVFTDGKSTLAEIFKLAGVTNPAKAGSLRLVSESIDAAKPPADEAPPGRDACSRSAGATGADGQGRHWHHLVRQGARFGW